MIRILACLSVLGLAACGADGEPVRPSLGASIGIGSGGVSVSPNVKVKTGPVSVGVGL